MHRTHGMKSALKAAPEYTAYINAKHRCTNPKDPKWKDYGGRGIKFLFTSFEQWFAELGPRPGPLFSVDRKDNNEGYEPGNVRWATKSEQIHNQRPQALGRGVGGRHNRWHVARGIVNSNCPLCLALPKAA